VGAIGKTVRWSKKMGGSRETWRCWKEVGEGTGGNPDKPKNREIINQRREKIGHSLRERQKEGRTKISMNQGRFLAQKAMRATRGMDAKTQGGGKDPPSCRTAIGSMPIWMKEVT